MAVIRLFAHLGASTIAAQTDAQASFEALTLGFFFPSFLTPDDGEVENTEPRKAQNPPKFFPMLSLKI